MIVKKNPIKWNFNCVFFALFFGIIFCLIGNAFSDEYTKLLIHSDTYNGDINFIDSSNSGHLITGEGDTVHSTQKQKFGSSAIYFDGSGDHLTVVDSDDWNFGDGDFTIDFWINTSYEAGEHAIITTGDSGPGATYRNAFEIYSRDGDIRAYYADGTNQDYLIKTGVFNGTWKHIAFSRNNSQVMLFVDGILADSKVITWTLANPSTNMTIGSRGTSQLFLTGYIDELRISKGIARWTSNFQPPAAPYEEPSLTPPIANAGPDQSVIDVVTLDGSNSTDTDGTINYYDWVLRYQGNSAYDRTADGVSPTVSNLEPGIYDVTLTVTDNDGLTGTDKMLLTVVRKRYVCIEYSCYADCVLPRWRTSVHTVPIFPVIEIDTQPEWFQNCCYELE